jgi:phosphopantetheine adenylyltransferase
LVKEVVGLGGDVSAFVPKNVLRSLKEKFKVRPGRAKNL